MEFTEFNLQPDLLEGVLAMGFSTATPIQAQSIPIIQTGSDLIACAQTGTGKTGAFLIPMMDKLSQAKKGGGKILSLILVPTRELAIQIDQQVQGLAYFAGLNSLAIYGGNDSKGWDQQKTAIMQGIDILIATPGRLLSHLALGYVDFSDIRFFVLDEADRMLDMGFMPDLQRIHKFVPESAQRLLFSATMPPNIRKLAQTLLRKPQEISIAVSKPAQNVVQTAYLTFDGQKDRLVQMLLKDSDHQSVIIFVSAKKKVSTLAEALIRMGLNAQAIHSDLDQSQREQVMLDFRNRKVQILVATDIVSRGIDITEIGLIINYDVPRDPEDYIHRVGRTARADASGAAITLINEKDQYSFKRIEKLIEKIIDKTPLPDQLGAAPKYDPDTNRRKFGTDNKRGGGGRNNDSKSRPSGKQPHTNPQKKVQADGKPIVKTHPTAEQATESTRPKRRPRNRNAKATGSQRNTDTNPTA
ncbi:MAG: hypothetical protein RIS47_2162 [Bacteroidota bacterium]